MGFLPVGLPRTWGGWAVGSQARKPWLSLRQHAGDWVSCSRCWEATPPLAIPCLLCPRIIEPWALGARELLQHLAAQGLSAQECPALWRWGWGKVGECQPQKEERPGPQPALVLLTHVASPCSLSSVSIRSLFMLWDLSLGQSWDFNSWLSWRYLGAIGRGHWAGSLGSRV